MSDKGIEYGIGDRVVVKPTKLQKILGGLPDPYLVVGTLVEFRDERKWLIGIRGKIVHLTFVDDVNSILRKTTGDDEASLAGGDKLSCDDVYQDGVDAGDISHVEMELLAVSRLAEEMFQKEREKKDTDGFFDLLLKKIGPAFDFAREQTAKQRETFSMLADAIVEAMIPSRERVALEVLKALIADGWIHSGQEMYESRVVRIVDESVRIADLLDSKLSRRHCEEV